MAAIDHTTIVWKNGEYIRETGFWNYEKDEWESTIPFEYGRDGNIHTILGERIDDKIKWYRDEYDAVYERDGSYIFGLMRFPYNIINWLKWHLGFMRKLVYRREIGMYKNGDVTVYIWKSNALNGSPTCVSFYNDSGNTYIVLGGYGHHDNVYTHFMSRGYGDDFERKMAYEAYEWILDDVIKEIAEYTSGNWDPEERLAMSMRKIFGVGLRDDSWHKQHWDYWIKHFEENEEDTE